MTTYYIDGSSTNASDKNAGTSADSPFKTLAALGQIKLQPGDTVALKAGTVYNVDAPAGGALVLRSSGTADNPITLTSYGDGAKPVINNTSSVLYSAGLIVQNAHYINVDGIGFDNAQQAAVSVDAQSSNITVSNCEMTNVGEGVQLAGSNNLVTENYIHDLHSVKNTPTDYTNATTIATTSQDDYGANGVVIAGSNNEVSYNRIINAIAPSYDFAHNGGGIELYGSFDNTSIHDNYVAASDGFLESGGTPNSKQTNLHIYNNVSYDNGNFVDFHNGGGAFGAQFSNVVIDHNTVVDDNNASNAMSLVDLDALPTSGQFNISNNIFSLNDGKAVFNQQGDYHSSNLFDLQSANTHLYENWDMTLGAGEQYGDPGLTDAAGGNFTSKLTGFVQSVGASIGTKLQSIISGDSTTATALNDTAVAQASVYNRSNGARVVMLDAGGQTVNSVSSDKMLAQSFGSNTFVFDAGYGHDLIRGFVLSGDDHDTISLPQSDFTSIADVLRHTQNTTGGAIIHDPASGDTLRLFGINKTELIENQADIKFHG